MSLYCVTLTDTTNYRFNVILLSVGYLNNTTVITLWRFIIYDSFTYVDVNAALLYRHRSDIDTEILPNASVNQSFSDILNWLIHAVLRIQLENTLLEYLPKTYKNISP